MRGKYAGRNGFTIESEVCLHYSALRPGFRITKVYGECTSHHGTSGDPGTFVRASYQYLTWRQGFGYHKCMLRKRLVVSALLSFFVWAGLATASAQDTVDSVLRPPKGSQVAIVVFEDLECPQCRRTAPILEQASKTYKIPLIQHDFPLPMHAWSYDAAIMARFFDTKSKAMGNEFRDYIFSSQLEINKLNLRGYAEKFATAHKVDLPFVIDPDGKLAAQVNADRDLGKAIKLEHTPTVYIVSNRHPDRPYIEVKDNNQLYALIDTMMKD
jgi:protein-disulfide isomerase